MTASVIIGIHGLANKPPNTLPEEIKKNWWRAAIIEGLQRNYAKTTDDLDFDFVYWADLRYPAPVELKDNPEPYYPATGTEQFPSYHMGKWVDIFNETATAVCSSELPRLAYWRDADRRFHSRTELGRSCCLL
jgi:hypothetical protein